LERGYFTQEREGMRENWEELFHREGREFRTKRMRENGKRYFTEEREGMREIGTNYFTEKVESIGPNG
jgi:hypothetical protein